MVTVRWLRCGAFWWLHGHHIYSYLKPGFHILKPMIINDHFHHHNMLKLHTQNRKDMEYDTLIIIYKMTKIIWGGKSQIDWWDSFVELLILLLWLIVWCCCKSLRDRSRSCLDAQSALPVDPDYILEDGQLIYFFATIDSSPFESRTSESFPMTE